MPRNQRATTALAERPRTRNSGGANELPAKPPRAKRAAEENIISNAKSRKRAAFGDLTNAVNERQTSLTKQVKKGLSNIVNKSRSSKVSSTSTAEVNGKKLKLALASNAKNQKKSTEDLTDSLPSSQEEKLQISNDPDLLEQSEYESAEE